MRLRFEQILREVRCVRANGVDAEIGGVEYDSRRVVAGSLFVAMRGGSADGNAYINQALTQGAAAVITDSAEVFERLGDRVAVAQVERGRRALAEASAAWFGHPEKKLKLTAVTGTNGKTTVAYLTEGLLRSADRACVLLGTIETRVAGAVRPSAHTTPESRDVLEVFAEGVRAGATEAVMEMSSHALEQERVWAMPVDVAVFTNLTQDHLDYHGTMDAYASAKAKLFEGVGAAAPRVAVINADDSYAEVMLKAAHACEVRWRYSLQDASAEFYASAVQLEIGRTRFRLKTPAGEANVESRLTGTVNVYNLTAAMAAAMARGMSLDACVAAAKELRPVPGRFETVPNERGLAVVVDYAHTDDALRNLTVLARAVAHTVEARGRVITVFGAGGDRDRTKRPKMGRAAGEGSDFVIVTSDNPRSEDPQAIAEEILPGVLATDVEYRVVLDRREAIAAAIGMAKPGDVVLIAGKGHEKTQTGREGAVPFDDVAVAAEVMR